MPEDGSGGDLRALGGLGCRREPVVVGVSSSVSPASVAAARRGVLVLSQVMGCRLLVAASTRRRPEVSDLAVAGSADLAR